MALRLDLVAEVVAQHAGFLDLGFMRIELVDDEIARRLDDHLLFFGEIEIHGILLDVEDLDMAVDGDVLSGDHGGARRGEVQAEVRHFFALR